MELKQDHLCHVPKLCQARRNWKTTQTEDQSFLPSDVLASYRLPLLSTSEMRPRLSPCGVLRACPNATPGPSRLPAGTVKVYQHSLPVIQVRNESTIPTRRNRQASTSSTSTSIPSSLTKAVSTSAYPHPAFDQLSTSLSSWLPCFGARGDEVKLLTSPGGFYGDVLEMMKRAKRRILISTLYIGVEETELVCPISFPDIPKEKQEERRRRIRRRRRRRGY